MEVEQKTNNSIGYNYLDGNATIMPSPFDLEYDVNSNTKHITNDWYKVIIHSTTKVQVTTSICPVITLPPWETHVAIFLDRKPSKGLALQSTIYDKSIDIELSGESRSVLGYHV